MRLDSLLHNIKCEAEVHGNSDCEVRHLTYDSRSVEAGSCFFAVVGSVSDGHDYIPQAVAQGGVAVVCERLPELLDEAVCYIKVSDVNRAMGQMATAFYGDPSRELKLVGITGTNGKTTTATLLADMFEALGYRTGLISTIKYRVAGREIVSTHTTPDAIRLGAMLREMVDAGCDYCFMEVSSHSVVQRRIEGLHFAGAIFSNLTHDHLDYHGTFAEYIKAKKGLFDGLEKGSFALINIDDRNGEVMVQNTKAEVARYSMQRMADYKVAVRERHADGMLLDMDGNEVWVQLLGDFNAYNVLAVYATARLLGFEVGEVLVALSKLHAVSGRFEQLQVAGGRTVVVDYAHTPDALSKALETAAEVVKCGAKIITVCGCGGDRDHAKRPEMARIAFEGSSRAIFTSDNPRGEEPAAILRDMESGVRGAVCSDEHQWLAIEDRASAIRTALMLSREGDLVLIAGKGHETYQIVAGVKSHFDDREEAQRAAESLFGNEKK